MGLSVVWVCGASGAGKSVAAWGLFQELAAGGEQVAYVDIDQVGMLYPLPDGDPGWHHAVKGEALAALVPGYVAAGARVLVVSGVVDPDDGPRVPDVDLTLCLLAPDPAVLRERILARGWSAADAEEAVAEDAALKAAAFVDVRIDTAGLSVAETVARLRDLVPVGGQGGGTREVASPASTRVVLVTGPRAVGSSTVGFGLARGRWRAGRRTGFLDLQQLGFMGGRSEVALAVGQLAVLHQLMTERGAELVVVSGHLSVPDRALVRAALPRAKVAVVRLRADGRTLAEHVRARVGGDDARLAADDLLGAGQEHQDAVVAAALAEQQVLDSAPADDAVLDVSGRTVDEVVAEVERAVLGRRLWSARVLRVEEARCEVWAGGRVVTVPFTARFPGPRTERVSPGHLVAVATGADGREVVVWRWYDAVVLGPDGDDGVRLWEPAHGEVVARPRPAYEPQEPGSRAYASAGLPGADWWVAGDAVELDAVDALYTEHGLWASAFEAGS